MNAICPVRTRKDNLSTRLNKFPNSFQLKLKGTEKLKRVKKVIQTVSVETEDDPQTFNSNRSPNLLTYLYLETGKRDKALQFNKDVRQRAPENIVAAANYVHISLLDEDLDEAENELQKLEQQVNESLLTEAKSELAYCYSRFGPAYHDDALVLFEEVTEKEPNNWLWQFGYGLVLQRCLSQKSYFGKPGFDGSETFTKALDAFNHVIKNEESHPLIVAKAWTKVQLCISLFGALPSGYKQDLRAVEPLLKTSLGKILSSKELLEQHCITMAMDKAPNDRTVLQDCGKYFKKHRNYAKARICLQKARDIHSNVVNCFQLADLELLEWEMEYEELQRSSCTVIPLGEESRGPILRQYSLLSDSRSVEDLSASTALLSTKQDEHVLPLSNVKFDGVDSIDNSKLKKALALYNEALKNSKDDVACVFMQLGRVHRMLRENDEAIDNFKKVLSVKSVSSLEKVVAYEHIGDCFSILANEKNDKNLEGKAHSYWLLAIELSALIDQSVPFNFECQCHFTLRDVLQQKCEANPRDTRVRRKAGKFLQLIGQHKKALTHYDDLIKLDPHNWEDHLSKARSLIECGDYREALCFLTMMLETEHKQKVLENKSVLITAAMKAAEVEMVEKRFTEAKAHFALAYRFVVGLDVNTDDKYDVFVTGQETGDPSHLSFFVNIIEKYFELKCFSSAMVDFGAYSNKECAIAMASSVNFLFVFPGTIDEDERLSLHFMEEVVYSITHVDRDFCSTSIVKDSDQPLPPSLTGLKLCNVPCYNEWLLAVEDSQEYVNLVTSLFRAIINFKNIG